MTLNRLVAQANRILAGNSPEGGDAKGLARLVISYAEELKKETKRRPS
jgi:hypothetical protein